MSIEQIIPMSKSGTSKYVLFLLSLGVAIALTVNFIQATMVLFVMLIAVMAAPFVIDLYRGKLDVFEIRNVFTFGFFMSFGISTLYSITIRLRYIEEPVFNRVLPRVLTYAIAAILFYYIGYYSHIPGSIAKKLPVLDSRWVRKRVAVVAILFAAFGIAFYLALLIQSGGLLFYIENIYRINDLLMGNYYLFLAAKAFLFTALIICYTWAQETLSARYALFAYFLLLMTFIFGITTGYRGSVFLPVIGMLVIRYYSASKLRFEKYFIVLFIAINILLIPIYSVTRYSSSEVGSFDSLEIEDSPSMVNVFNRYYGVESFALIVDEIDHGLELQKGKTLFSFFYEFIPRDIWPDKPFSTGFLFVDIFMPDYFFNRLVAGMSTLPGELYWNFSLIGMVIGMTFAGLLFKTSYVYFKININKSAILVYLPFIFYAFAINEGSIAGHAITDLISYEVPIFIGYMAMRPRAR